MEQAVEQIDLVALQALQVVVVQETLLMCLRIQELMEQIILVVVLAEVEMAAMVQLEVAEL